MLTSFSKKNITGLILAGGAGRRVARKDKGLITYQGLSLIEKQIQWLRPQVNTILISANRNIAEYTQFGYPVLTDNDETFKGPLQGVLKGLENCSTEFLFVQPVDVPDLPVKLIELLLNHIAGFGSPVCADCYYLKSDRREHYLSMLIHKKCSTKLKKFLDLDNRRVNAFHQEIGSVVLDLNLKESVFKNLNFQSDF